VAENLVDQNEQLSSEIRYGFQKNRLIALNIVRRDYKSRRIFEFGAFWPTIWRLVIFISEIFHLFL